MCGRYVISADMDVLGRYFGVTNRINFPRQYNAAPAQRLPIITGDTIRLARWGYIPSWAIEPAALKHHPINARLETAADKPLFSDSFSKRRCLVPANGFYEWEKAPDGKQPWYFYPEEDLSSEALAKEEVMAIAGIWSERAEEGETVTTFALLTKEAVEPVKGIHARMPVILPAKAYQSWMDADKEEALNIALNANVPLQAHPVSRDVGRVANNYASLIRTV